MFLTKTDKARLELQPGRRTLGQRERALLLMADGQRSLTDFGALFGGREEAGRVARHLVQEGYLRDRPIDDAPVAADAFDGKPSMATTRMFLFDLCERMFVRRDPVLAERLREALRAARDRTSMLATASTMLDEIEKMAGVARAEAIRERIDKLLPASPVH